MSKQNDIVVTSGGPNCMLTDISQIRHLFKCSHNQNEIGWYEDYNGIWHVWMGRGLTKTRVKLLFGEVTFEIKECTTFNAGCKPQFQRPVLHSIAFRRKMMKEDVCTWNISTILQMIKYVSFMGHTMLGWRFRQLWLMISNWHNGICQYFTLWDIYTGK